MKTNCFSPALLFPSSNEDRIYMMYHASGLANNMDMTVCALHSLMITIKFVQTQNKKNWRIEDHVRNKRQRTSHASCNQKHTQSHRKKYSFFGSTYKIVPKESMHTDLPCNIVKMPASMKNRSSFEWFPHIYQLTFGLGSS